MIYLLRGEDDLSLGEALASMKEAITPAELRDVNIATLRASEASLERLAATCDTVPFLANKRMVIVEGLLALFERRSPPRGAPPKEQSLGQWAPLPDSLKRMPQTTELVFVEGRISEANPMLGRIRPLVKSLAFPLPPANQLGVWIRQRAAKRGIELEPGAVRGLAEAIGRNPRVIDQELQKLALYRWGQPVRQEDVVELVAYVKEANIFAAVDAVLDGRPGVAIRLVHQLLESGTASTHLLALMARQVRLLLLAKELKAQRVTPAEIGKRLALSGYPLDKTLEQEGRLTADRLSHIHRKLLEADASVKIGGQDEGLVLDVLIAELASRPPSG